MMRGIVPALEKHHGVRILDEGLAAAVKFSHRYLPDRHLPDKAVSVLDTACARLALGQNATPAAIEDACRQLDDFAVQTRVLERESALGADHCERLTGIAAQKAKVEQQLAELQARWEQERDLVTRIREIRARLEEPATDTDQAALRVDLAVLNTELERLQGESPLIRVCVDAHIVGDVVSAWTGIPIGKMMRDEIATALALDQHLGRRVIGQNHALAGIAERIRTSKASLEE